MTERAASVSGMAQAWLAAALGLSMLAGCGESDGRSASPTVPASADGVAGPALFTDVTSEAGLASFRHETGAVGDMWFPETMGPGGGFADIDGDGDPDVVLVSGGKWSGPQPPAVRLFANDGDGTFTERTSEYGLDRISAYGMGVTAVDYDGDHDQDLFVTALRRDLLLRNDGGEFVDATEAVGLSADTSWSTAAVFFDADGDNDLDLYVGKYARWSPSENVECSLDGKEVDYCTPEVYDDVAGRFYRHRADGTFEDATSEAGFVSAPGKNLGAVSIDYNRDGWTDLVVANDQKRNLLYKNEGDGTFRERGLLAGIAFNDEGKARAGMGMDTGVLDTTGRPTIIIGNFSQERIAVFRYAGNDLFDDRDIASGLGNPGFMPLTFGLFVFDADLNGTLDVLAANGHLQERISQFQDGVRYRQRAQLFFGDGNGRFVEHEPSPDDALSEHYLARAAAYGDVDTDGDLDVLLTENGGGAVLLRNNQVALDENGSRYLRVRLSGRGMNTDAIGTNVTAYAEGAVQERTVRTGSSYLSNVERTLTFGLGGRNHVDSLVVRWPSGSVDRFVDVESNQLIQIDEAGGELRRPATSPQPPA